MSEISEECPLLDKCERLVSKDVYESFCKSKNWIYCPQFKKKPREWKRENRKRKRE